MNYEEYIIYDSADSADSEKDAPEQSTSEVTIKKRVRAKNATLVQFQKISDFMKLYDKKMIGKLAYNQLWDELVGELNEHCSSPRTSEQWKQAWFDHKSKKIKKQKLTMKTLEEVDTSCPKIKIDPQTSSSSASIVQIDMRPKKITSKLDEAIELVPLHFEDVQEHEDPSTFSTSKMATNESIDSHFQLRITEKVDAIAEKLAETTEQVKKVSTIMEAIAEGINKTNELLEKLLSK